MIVCTYTEPLPGKRKRGVFPDRTFRFSRLPAARFLPELGLRPAFGERGNVLRHRSVRQEFVVSLVNDVRDLLFSGRFELFVDDIGNSLLHALLFLYRIKEKLLGLCSAHTDARISWIPALR